MTHTQLKLLRLLKKWFGGSIRMWRQEQRNWKTLYQWKINSRSQIKPFLESIQPYLFLKKRNSELLLKLIESYNKFGQSYPPPSKETLDSRWGWWQEVRILNRRGVQPQRLSEIAGRELPEAIVQAN